MRQEIQHYEIHKKCGHVVNRIDVPCPQNKPGCIVRHFKLVCIKCGDIGYMDKEGWQTNLTEVMTREAWRFKK